MSEFETALSEVDVLIDDLLAQDPPSLTLGPAPKLTRSEVVTVAMVSQLSCFASVRAFYRFAERQVRGCFPRLPHRTQFVRQLHRHADPQCQAARAGLDAGGDDDRGQQSRGLLLKGRRS